MIVVPKWEWSQTEGWIIEKSALVNFLEVPSIDVSGSSYWTEIEMKNLFPKIGSEGTTKVSFLWEILEHQKKQLKSAA